MGLIPTFSDQIGDTISHMRHFFPLGNTCDQISTGPLDLLTASSCAGFKLFLRVAHYYFYLRVLCAIRISACRRLVQMPARNGFWDKFFYKMPCRAGMRMPRINTRKLLQSFFKHGTVRHGNFANFSLT
jgi:hypothetical protein